jgi:hypothetical protein
MMIIDLSNLPSSIDTNFWTADSVYHQQCHNIFIDEKGFAYLFGSNAAQGALFVDLAIPDSPAVVGYYSQRYMHDGFVRGDTLWGAEIFSGVFSVIDVAIKDSPVVLATQFTPRAFTHNVWLSDDGQTLFTTDERSGATVAAYDVSDLSDIKLLDEITTNPWSGVIPHNVHVVGNHLVAAFYRDGIAIIDATDPSNLVVVDGFDTSPFESGNGFQGAWGVYPYFPSGNMIVSDIEEGLFVLAPDYPRAAYLEGVITDVDGKKLHNVGIEIEGTTGLTTTDIAGHYKTGTGNDGTFTVRIFNDSCYEKRIPNVQLVAGQTTVLNDFMLCPSNTTVFDFFGAPNPFFQQAKVYYSLSFTVSFHTRIMITDAMGRVMDELHLESSQGEFSFGSTYPPGVYFVRLVDQNFEKTVKLVKLK